MKKESRWYATDGVERKKVTGEVFTPETMGDEMVELLMKHDPSLLTGTFLDPSCGDGNLLICVLRYKIAHGVNPLDALNSLYGIELMADNAQTCRERLARYASQYVEYDACLAAINNVEGSSYPHIVCHDTLLWDVERWQPIGEVDWITI